MKNSSQILTNNEMPEPSQAAIMEGLAFVSKVFWGPDLEFCQSIHEDGGRVPTREPAGWPTMEPFKETVAQIDAVIHSYQDAETLFNDLEASYVSLFISNREGIAAPLYHSCYAGPEGTQSEPLLMGAPAVEMRKRLASSGLALDGDLNQLPDHLCIEIEYLYFLLDDGWNKGHQSRLAEARDFAGDWMLPWVRQFQEHLKVDEETRFYSLVAGLLVELLMVVSGRNSR